MTHPILRERQIANYKPRLIKRNEYLWACVGLKPIGWIERLFGDKPVPLIRYGVTPKHAFSQWKTAVEE